MPDQGIVGAPSDRSVEPAKTPPSPDKIIARCLRDWNLEAIAAPRVTPSSTLLLVQGPADREAILKVFNPASNERLGATALRHFGQAHAVTVYETAEDAVLLERAVPGTQLSTLVSVGGDDEATTILCDTMAAIHRTDPLPESYPTIEAWGRAFADYRNSHDQRLPLQLVDRAEQQFFDLAKSQAPLALLHGDLHHDNLLFDHERGWRVIDPKGVIGEPAYETGAMLRNPVNARSTYSNADVIDRRVSIIVERLGFDRQRILQWAFTQLVLSEIWMVQDGLEPPADAPDVIGLFAQLAR